MRRREMVRRSAPPDARTFPSDLLGSLISLTCFLTLSAASRTSLEIAAGSGLPHYAQNRSVPYVPAAPLSMVRASPHDIERPEAIQVSA